jgi:two-component system sensor histidine kinase UhpB
MSKPLRILLIEDSKEDAELLLREICRGGYDPAAERVDSAAGLQDALVRAEWDLVISDYVMPGFGGLEALTLFRARGLNIPFIIVSGHIGEDIAVIAMKAGADDYLMKDRLARLVPAIERALEEAKIRRAHLEANQALRDSEIRFRQLAENIGAVFFMFEHPGDQSPGTLSYVSPAFEKIWGYPCANLFSDPGLWIKSVYPDDRAGLQARLPRLLKGDAKEEFRITRKDLGVRWVEYRTFPVRNEAGAVYRIAAIAEDISERKRAEEQLGANARQLQNTVQELRLIEEELRHRNEELSQAREKLEHRVRERTADLTAANSELKRQMEERRRLENELLEIAENERRRIGFDLHDDIGQKLMGVSLLLKALEKNLTHKGLAEANDTIKLQALINEVINHTHDLAHSFSSLDLQGADLGVFMEKLVANAQRTFHIGCRFRTARDLPALPPDTTMQLYKIAQESVSNAIKHGKATKIFISLSHQDGELVMRIKNDGVPFPIQREPSRRLGLRIMDYRARTIGGTLEIRPHGKSGTLVTCVLPVANGHRNGQRSLGKTSASKKEIAPETITAAN